MIIKMLIIISFLCVEVIVLILFYFTSVLYKISILNALLFIISLIVKINDKNKSKDIVIIRDTYNIFTPYDLLELKFRVK